MLEVKNLTKTYPSASGNKKERFLALDDVSVTVNSGQIFGFIGLSGAGKTSLARCIAALEKSDSGEILFAGEGITTLKGKALRQTRKQMGFVFQHFNLLMNATIFENIAFPLRIAKMPKDEINKLVTEMGEKVGLNEQQLQKKVNELSGGQQQRVAIARALVTAPAIICLDEPLSNLDAKLRVKLRNELKDLQRKFGITTVYVTHDQEEALTLSDRIAVFNNGFIEQVGTPEEVYKESATDFVCNFIGDINELDENFLSKLDMAGSGKKSYIRLENIYVNAEFAHHSKLGGAKVIDREYYGLYVKYTLNLDGSLLKIIEKASSNSLYEINEIVQVSLNKNNILQY